MANQENRCVRDVNGNFSAYPRYEDFRGFEYNGDTYAALTMRSISIPYYFGANGGGYYKSSGAGIEFYPQQAVVDASWGVKPAEMYDFGTFTIEFTLMGYSFTLDTSRDDTPSHVYDWDSIRDLPESLSVTARIRWDVGWASLRQWHTVTFTLNRYYTPSVLVLTMSTVVNADAAASISYEYWGYPFVNPRINIEVEDRAVQALSGFTGQSGTISWTPTTPLYAPYFPSSITGCVLTFKAYSLTPQGYIEAEKDFNVSLNLTSSMLLPVLSTIVSDGATKPSAFSDVFVTGISFYRIKPTVSTKYGASVESIEVTAVGETYNAINDSYMNTAKIRSTSDNKVIFLATDSRGLTCSVEKTMTLAEWFPPTFGAFEVRRGYWNSTTYRFTPDDNGDWCEIAVKNVNFAPVSNLNSASAVVTRPDSSPASLSVYNYKVIDERFYVPADTESSYAITLTLTDSFTTVTRTVRLSTAGVVLDVKSGGSGLGLGKVAEYSECVEVNPEWDFRCYGMTLADYIRSIVQDMN